MAMISQVAQSPKSSGSIFNNEIPIRFIDTSARKFVERKDVFDIFQDEIAKGDRCEVIAARIKSRGWNPQIMSIDFLTRDEAIRDIIQEIVKYAVFSHRWDAAGEPTYRDVTTGKHRCIAGFKKLTLFCKIAKSLGYKLAWSDTCCIDKSNTVELSETINAMFQWYSPLPLVHYPPRKVLFLLGLRPRAVVHHAAGRSKNSWLPRRVKFYNRTWQPLTSDTSINDKEDKILLSCTLRRHGHPRGGYHALVLDNREGINERSVWEIMSWASKRKTTRVEDMTYSLIGLFGVNIPIAYGEGERAFPRLVETIMMTRPNWDVFAWVGRASPDYPAIPCSPACYPEFNKQMVGEYVGIRNFTMTDRVLHLSSLPLIPMMFESASKDGEEIYNVILKPRSNADRRLVGVYSNVTVKCSRWRHKIIPTIQDLSLCILNFQVVIGAKRGKLEVGREYVCFLLHSEYRDGEESTWVKFTTHNSLRVSCMDKPKMSTQGMGDIDREQTGETEGGVFTLPLEITSIRCPAYPAYIC
ncbi:hypothetical protein BU15DRAFT_75308 [Melanogaster broomeanus]|nr:hypothetical protein BU15DRAFT_75308 [Melanogaster broomeanus]